MKLSNEIKVGILVLVSLAILFLGYNFLKGQNVFGQENVYFVEYDRVDGLLVSNPVQINGYQIGVVDDIYLKENNTNKIIVKFSVEEGVNLYQSDSAEIVSTSLLGDKALEIKLQEVGKRSTNLLQSQDTVPGLVAVDVFEYAENELMPIKNKVERLLTQLDTTVGSVNRVMSSKQMEATMTDVTKSVATVEHTLKDLNKLVKKVGAITNNLNDIIEKDLTQISGVIENVDDLSGELAQNTKGLTKIMTNAENFTKNLNEIDLKTPVNQLNETIGEVKGLSKNANSLVTNLNTTIDETGVVISQVGSTIEEVGGTVDKMSGTLDEVTGTVEQVGSSVSDLSGNLQTTSTTADSTMRDLTVTINEVNDLLVKIKQGEGSAGQLVTDKQLYNNLAGVSDNLNKLLVDLKSNPKEYVGFSIFSGKRYEERQRKKEERRKARGE